MSFIITALEPLTGSLESVYTFFGDFVYNFFSLYSREILNTLHFVFKNLFDILLYITIFLTFIHFFMAFIVSFKKSNSEKSINDSDLPNVTIQIPTYNEIAALNCAKKCLEFDYPKNKYQIIIGDDSSNKESLNKINSFASLYKN